MADLTQALAAAREALKNSHATANERPHWLALEAAMSDLLAALDAAQPVAWGARDETTGEIARCESAASWAFPNGTPTYSVPLYLAPQAPPAAVPAQGDDRILWGVVANAGRLSKERKPRWAHVSDATGLGSGYSADLCRRFGRDPDEELPAALAEREGRGEVQGE